MLKLLMLGMARYLISGNRDTMTGYVTLHPDCWDKVQASLTKAVARKQKSLRVDLTDVGSSDGGNDMQVFTYYVVGANNIGDDEFKGEIPCNSISFKLSKRGKINSYSFDAVDSAFDCSNQLKKGYTRGMSSRPLSLEEVFKQNDILKSPASYGGAFNYFDNVLWDIQQYGLVNGGDQIGSGGGTG